MVVFIGFLAVVEALHKIDNHIWLTHCEYWIYPIQTIVCGWLVIRFWADYEMARPKRAFLGIAIGIVVFLLWISPQAFFGFGPRTNGFNPMSIFGNQSSLYWPTVIMRFVRLVVVVPLVEEIFWRGFLLRYFIREDFEQVSFGSFSWLSFLAVTLAFGFSHSAPDWPAAILTGAIYNGVAYSTKSLSTCLVTHAATNLLLGLWIMQSGQWGFW